MKANYCYSFATLFWMTSCIAISSIGFGQDPTVKDLQANATKEIKKEKIDSGKIWKTGGLFTLNIGQGSQSNWAAGGDDFSFSLASYLGFYAFYKKTGIAGIIQLILIMGC